MSDSNYRKLNKALQRFQGGSDERTQRSGIILSITLQGNNEGWLFEWPSTGEPYYRIVLRGEEIDRVINDTNGMLSYVYDGIGFSSYPSPLEIMGSSMGLAPSEINEPFLVIQWYGVATADHYRVQEQIDGNWIDMFEIGEIGATVYSWTTGLLVDETNHNYRVLAYNEIAQAGTPLAFDITPVVTPPDFVEPLYDITYDGVGNNFVLDLAE